MKEQEIKNRIAEIENELANFELDPDEYTEEYDDFLDEVSDSVRIGSLEYAPSHVLKEVDPIAYRCGLNDYIDNINIEDHPVYQELTDELEDLKNELENKEVEVDD